MSEIDTKIKASYEAGEAAGRTWGIQLGIEMGLKRAMEITSRDLHNFKFPEGQIPIDMPLEQHAPKDDSTFEFSYNTYAERVKEKEAESAADREARTFTGRRRSNRIMANSRRNRK